MKNTATVQIELLPFGQPGDIEDRIRRDMSPTMIGEVTIIGFRAVRTDIDHRNVIQLQDTPKAFDLIIDGTKLLLKLLLKRC
jgi:hypothetical protein